MSKLAIFGGKPVRTELFKAYNTIGAEERKAVDEVLRSGVLSKYLGSWHPDFFGGPKVQELEKMWSERIGVKHSVTVNSNTSGLITAMGAVGIQPGDEVIVSPYSMSASAVAPIFWGGVPVFADIDENNFCMSPESISSKITPRTKAILIVHIFGQAAAMDEIMEIAKANNLYVIEDVAQAPYSIYKERHLGTIGHLGVFSLNYHKHIHTGEGGIITTNDDRLAERCQLIRNHGETVVEAKGVTNIQNIFGYNFRLPEMESAIGIEQIKKLDKLVDDRISNAKYLEENLKSIPYFDVCIPPSYVKHNYYQQPMKYFADQNHGLHRDQYLKVISAELPSSFMREEDPLISGGYVKPLYLQPIYQRKAFNLYHHKPDELDYSPGICPVVERMHFHELITHEFMRPSMSKSDMDQVIEAFYKIDKYMPEIISRQDEL
jgi:perosamine synthetase